MKQIPAISLRALKENDQTAVDALGNACKLWGFFRLIELDLDAGTIDRFLTSMRVFFDLPHNEKQQLARTSTNPWGYFDRELTKNRQDWKEIYDLGIDQSNTEYESRTPWPQTLPGFRDAMLHWHKLCDQVSLTLLESIALSLGLERSSLTSHFTAGNSSFLRLNHYPVCETPAKEAEDFPTEGHLGIHHHTDAGAVTVLLQDDVAGLQVRHGEAWVTVPDVPDSLIVNVGDLVQVWSNDQYEAPLHRVLASTGQERFSAAFFMNPDFSADCKPQTPGTALYRTVNWGQFRAARAAGDYANLGEEAQISDYRI